MATASRKRSLFTLIGLTLMASVLFALLTGGATATPAGAKATPAAASAPSLDGLYQCADHSIIRIKWTRQMPQNGWLGEITTYAGNVVKKGMQAYNPINGTSGQVRWGYQTQDGNVLCRSMLVLPGGREIAFSQCRNWREQSCALFFPGVEAE